MAIFIVRTNTPEDRNPTPFSNASLHSAHESREEADKVAAELTGTNIHNFSNGLRNAWVEERSETYVLVRSKKQFGYDQEGPFTNWEEWMPLQKYQDHLYNRGPLYPGGDVIVQTLPRRS